MKIITKNSLIITTAVITLNFTFKKEKTPPGTVEFSTNLYIDQTEVSNQNWIDYMNWTKKSYGENSNEYKAIFPDTSVWKNENKPFATYYLTHNAYKNYPVVGVSYEQAVSYCKWRSNRVNFYLAVKKGLKKWNDDNVHTNVPKIYSYRLPTKQEWEDAAVIGYKKHTQRKINKTKAANFNYNRDIATVTTPVTSYYSNKLGVYNMLGNVAEMTNKKGIAKGGSWKHKKSEVANITLDNKYTKPQNWLGFRCVAVKLK